MRKVVVFTGTRADWGLLSPVAKALQEGGAEVIVAATNAHLSHRHGYTLQEIVDDGFRPLTIPIDTDDDSALGRSRAMAQCLEGAARLIAEMKPDLALILGDRYEMLAAATACLMATLPIVHIAGGAISEGAVDDAIRHSISKMAALHLTETEPYRR
ncbi:MAG: UDP-N-acetylglucosamine 2-epimerase, partial [Muribaculaceae bacterium]|nr:UDP-N-acetylglucosamine 2-epimerase [Muribaculaceae bacterium]